MTTKETKTMTRIRNRRQAHRARGFSLIELMVVIAIIAMLATVVAVNVLGVLDDATATKAAADIKGFETALVAYKITFKRFPSTEDGLDALINNSKGKNFLTNVKTIPTDPWGNEYEYTLEGSKYVIISKGADGQPGGTGENADIRSDELGDDKKDE